MNIIDLYDNSYNLYYIGGVVRDKLLAKESLDIDITVEGDAIEFCKSLTQGEILQVNEPFGTVKMQFGDRTIDFASTRAEKYPKKGHLPVVTKIGCSLKEDVLRRDFTINSLAENVKTGEIIDYVGGLEDLKNKKLRVLHKNSFIDDPTRILRGLKFAHRFGFELEAKTFNLQKEYLKNINYDMSYKRLKDELISTFNLNSQKVFEKFINQKIYKLLTTKKIELPIVNIENLIDMYKPEVACPWLIYVAVVDAKCINLTKFEQKIIEDYEHLLTLDLKNDFEIYRAFEKLNIESLLIYAIKNDYSKVLRYLNNLRKIKISISGSDLNELGYEPSNRYSLCFDEVLKEKLRNPNISKDIELEIAREFL